MANRDLIDIVEDPVGGDRPIDPERPPRGGGGPRVDPPKTDDPPPYQPSLPKPKPNPGVTLPLPPRYPGDKPDRRQPGRGKKPGRIDPLPPKEPDDSAIVPRPVPRTNLQKRTETFLGRDDELPAVYGPLKTDATLVYYKKQNDGRHLCLYKVCWGPIGALPSSGITIGGATISQLKLESGTGFNIYLGTKTQGLDPLMVAREPNWVSAFPGVVYIVVLFKKPTALIPAVDVQQIELKIDQGMLVYDPRADATLTTRFYRPYVALSMADYMTSQRYGGRLPLSSVYSSAELVTSANYDEEDLGGGRRRFPFGMKVDGSRDYEGWIETMRACGQKLRPQYNDGVYHIITDRPQSPLAITFTDQGSNANIVTVSPLRVAGVEDSPTEVRVSHLDSAGDYKEDWAVSEDPRIGTGEVERYSRDYDLRVPNHDVAGRLARYIRKRLAQDTFGQMRVNAEGARVLPSSVISVTDLEDWNVNATPFFVNDASPVGDEGDIDWNLEVNLYSATVFDDSEVISSGYVTPVVPSPYDQPPDVVDLSLAMGDDYAKAWWGQPKIRSATLYGASFWSAVNVGSFAAANVNNADLTDTAGTWGSGDAYFVFDAGVGNTKAFREGEWSYDTTSPFANSPLFGYSDNGTSWTQVPLSAATKPIVDSGNIRTTTVIFPASVGAHRFWRLRRGTGTDATKITEIWLREYTEEIHHIKGWRIYDNRSGTRDLYVELPATDTPTSTAPMNLSPIMNHVPATATQPGDLSINFTVTAVTTKDVESVGLTVSVFTFGAGLGGHEYYVPQIQGDLFLGNGTNNNVDAGPGPGMRRITGITAAATITGLIAPTGGGVWAIIEYTGSQTVTFANQHASSSAANRIITKAGVDISLAGPFTVVLWYDITEARWIVHAATDGTSYPLAGQFIVAGSASVPFEIRKASADSYGRALTGGGGYAGWLSQTSNRHWYAGVQTAGTTYIVRDVTSGTDIVHVTSTGRLGVAVVPTERIETPGYIYAAADDAGVIVDASGSQRAGFIKAAGLNPEIRYLSTIGLKVRRVTTGTVKTATASDVPLEFGSDGKVAIGGGAGIQSHLSGTTTWNPVPLATGTSDLKTLTVTGAVVGDTVTVGFSIDLQGLILTGYVSSSNTVTAVLYNPTGGSIDLGSGTLRADVWRH